MKNTTIILALVALVISLVACEDKSLPEPVAYFEIETDSAIALDRVLFKNMGSGEYYTYFTGDSGHVYEQRTNGHLGISGDLNGNLDYSYKTSGDFEVTLVVSTYDYDSRQRKEDIFKKRILVKDNDAYFTIDQLYLNNIGQYSYLTSMGYIGESHHAEAAKFDENNYIVYLYNYHRYYGELENGEHNYYTSIKNVKTFPQHLISYVSTITVEGFDEDEYVDRFTAVDYTHAIENIFTPKKHIQKSPGGGINEFNVMLLQIPEFRFFRIYGEPVKDNYFFVEKRKIIYSPFLADYSNFHRFTLDIDLNDTVDVTNLTPDFEFFLPAYTKAYVDGVEQVSGVSSHDFTNPVTYHLVYKQPGYEDTFTAESDLVVTVK